MTNEYKTNGISKMQKHKSLVVMLFVFYIIFNIITHIGDPAAKIYSENEFVAWRWDNGTIFATKFATVIFSSGFHHGAAQSA